MMMGIFTHKKNQILTFVFSPKNYHCLLRTKIKMSKYQIPSDFYLVHTRWELFNHSSRDLIHEIVGFPGVKDPRETTHF